MARRQWTLLVVPDDLLQDELGETFLDRDSLQVRTSNSADDAVATSQVWLPHLVVFRSKLESRSVARFCQTLKSQPTPPRLLMVHFRHRQEKMKILTFWYGSERSSTSPPVYDVPAKLIDQDWAKTEMDVS